MTDLHLLCATAASIGFLHTLLGPDHAVLVTLVFGVVTVVTMTGLVLLGVLGAERLPCGAVERLGFTPSLE